MGLFFNMLKNLEKQTAIQSRLPILYLRAYIEKDYTI